MKNQSIEKIISPATLRDLLDYNPATGKLHWKPRPQHMFSDKGGRQRAECQRWNGNWAGREALAHLSQSGALDGSIFARQVLAHRVAWAIYYGEWPKKHIDHINGDRADNRISNLRDVTGTENNRNAKRRKDNKSGYAGVYKYKKRFRAHIKVDGKMKVIGSFPTALEAHEFREIEKLKYGYHPNHGRG
jgi:hypothetical protein